MIKKKGKLFRAVARVCKRIARKFRRPRTMELYVMTVDEKSQYSGLTYPKNVILKQLESRSASRPLLAYMGDMPTGDYPIVENSLDKAAGYVHDFRLEGNKLYASMTTFTSDMGVLAAKVVKGIGVSNIRLSPAGYGNTSQEGIVADDYTLSGFALKMR